MNPYKTTGPVETVEKFYGFTDQKKQVFDVIDQSISGATRNICFIGEPNTGKTSFLNISKEYANKYSQLSVELRISDIESSYEFFNDYFSSLLQSLGKKHDRFIYMKKDYDEIAIRGTNVENCSLLFPYKYYQWDKSGKPVDDFPNYATIIKNDIVEIITELREADVENPPSKIFFFIDDFQYISGFNEKGIIDPDVNQDLYIKSADNICKILRSIVDDYKTSIVLVISTYPGIFKVSEHMKRLTDTRYSEKISIDKYEDKVETEELFIESLKVLNEDNIWKQVYYNGDKDVIKKIILDKNFFDELQINRLQDIFYNKVKDNEIEDIVDIVHDQSEGRPSYIKPLLAEIYELYQKPILANDLTLIIDYKDNEKMQKIYKNIGNEFGDNEIYKILDNYTPEQKFHLYLFLNNSRLTVEEISQLLNLSRARFILKNFCQNEYNIKDVALETIDSDDTFFGDYKDDISNITNEKLKKSIKQFKKDQLINYNTDDSIKTVHKLRLIDFNYVITHLKTLGFPNIYNRSNPIGGPGGSGSFFQTLIPMLGSMGYHRPSPLPLRPDLNENEQIENISNFIQTMTEVRNLSDIKIGYDLVYKILEKYARSKSNREINKLFSQESWLELYTIVNTKVDTTGLNIAILKGNLRRQAIDKLVDYSDYLLGEAPLKFQTINKIKCDDTLGKAVYNICNLFIDKGWDEGWDEDKILSKYINDLSYRELWEYGDVRSAIKKIKKLLNNEKVIAQKDVLENEVNNGTYLALSTNNRKEIESWFNYKASVTGFKVRSYIKKYSGNHALTNYNFILIRHYIENYSLNNLVELFKKVVNNEDGEILDDAKQGTLSCLIIKNQNKLVFQEINTITTYCALISSIKNLTANGFDLKMTKNIERLINKEVQDVHTLAEELKSVDFTPLKDEEDEA